jgi:peptidoglycan glycosyltransferase
VQLVIASAIAQRTSNPRHALLDANRGRIVASDGTVLAQTQGGKREYPMGAQTAALVGYVSQRYGTSGIEAAFDRALTPPDASGDAIAQLEQIAGALRGSTDVAAGADIVTTIVPAIQAELYSGLSRYGRAAGVVLDPQTGAVLAIAAR